MKLLDFFREHNEDIITLLEDLVRLESPTSDKYAVDQLGNFIVEQLEETGAQIEIFPRREVGDIIYAAWNGGMPGKPILLLCHMDTVWPVGTLADMPLWRDGSRLYGPGILDMKAGIALTLKTIGLLRQHGGLPRRPIWALFTTDEEQGDNVFIMFAEKIKEFHASDSGGKLS
ncbi:MAG TPA: M20/M25/M40 family metallo-hydrolase, partial [Aggregatilineaceae bacterium]|nr:M20/M25/M40 family metallo-hydrolase [Aggregatilineaceae bacterium]